MTTRMQVMDALTAYLLTDGFADDVYDILHAAGLLVPDETPQPKITTTYRPDTPPPPALELGDLWLNYRKNKLYRASAIDPTVWEQIVDDGTPPPKRGLSRIVIRDDGRVEAYNDLGELSMQSRSDSEPGYYDWRDLTPAWRGSRCQVLADRAEPPFRCEKNKGHKGPHKTTEPDRYWISAEPCPEEADTAKPTTQRVSAEDYKAKANLETISGTINAGTIRTGFMKDTGPDVFKSSRVISPAGLTTKYKITEPMPPSLIEAIEGTVWLAEHDAAIHEGIAACSVLSEVAAERVAQDLKWGEQNHDPVVWGAILGEEVGELAQAMLNDLFGGDDHTSHSESMRNEAVQVAAVAVAFIEYLDRVANRAGITTPTETPARCGCGGIPPNHHPECDLTRPSPQGPPAPPWPPPPGRMHG